MIQQIIRKIALFVLCLSSLGILLGLTLPSVRTYTMFEVSSGSLEFLYFQRPSTIFDHVASGTTVVNGSYFWGNYLKGYFPAGLWIDNGKIINGIDYQDPNLAWIVRYDASLAQLAFQKREVELKGCSQKCLAFQAGPMVIEDGVIAKNYFWSWHAKGKHERTLLGQTRSGRIFIFIFIQEISLPKVARQVAKNPIFRKDPLTLMNLDGWPSTSYLTASGGHTTTRTLPILLRFRQH